MRTLSLDLRERILASYDNEEGSRQEIADRYRVSLGMVKKLLQQRKGFPLQFMLIKEKSRCSILFHLLVAGGRWQTWMGKPSSSASFWSSTFHNRTREPLLPPPSAMICKHCGFG